MRELKPQLIIADSGRRRRGGGGGFWSFLAFLIVFAVGVFVGTKLDDYGIFSGWNDQTGDKSIVSENTTPSDSGKAVFSDESAGFTPKEDQAVKEPAVIISEKIQAGEGVTSDSLPDENPTDGFVDEKEAGLTSVDPEMISSPDGVDKEENAAQDDASPDSAEIAAEDIKSEPQQSVGGYRYTLQIAAFATPEEADEVVNEFKSKGYDAYTVNITNSKGEEWNLVKIGRFGTIEQAWDEAVSFKRREGKDAFVETMSHSTAVNESWDRSKKAEQ